MNPDWTWRGVCGVIGADAGGAWIGFKAGAELSGANPYVSGGCAVILGAINSYGASRVAQIPTNSILESAYTLNTGEEHLGNGHNNILNILVTNKPTDDAQMIEVAFSEYCKKYSNKNLDVNLLKKAVLSVNYSSKTDFLSKDYLYKNFTSKLADFIYGLTSKMQLTNNQKELDVLLVQSRKDLADNKMELTKSEIANATAGLDVMDGSIKYWSNY
jgi:hypothetical protein